MKRLIYTMVAGAVMVASSSSLAMADKGKGRNGNGDDDNEGRGNGQKVVMCHQPNTPRSVEITVRVKDVPEHQSQGDILGSCPAPSPPPIIGIVG